MSSEFAKITPERSSKASVNNSTSKGMSMPAVPALLNPQNVIQKLDKEDDEPVQKKPLQFKNYSIQRQQAQDEPLQKKPFQLKSDPVQRQTPDEQENPLQGKFIPAQRKENTTGLPDNLKTGVENLSGIDISDVKVYYNSPKSAQLQALAYAQGTDIHVGPGQERHLPHEAWHVVQQKQGRVQPTVQMKQGIAVNDDKGLEREADVMGQKAIQKYPSGDTKIKEKKDIYNNSVVQRQLAQVVGQPYFTDNRDGTNQQFTPTGGAPHPALTGAYDDHNGYHYQYDAATREYEVGGAGTNVFWDVEHQMQYNRLTNMAHNLTCYELNNNFNNRYFYRNFHYVTMPGRAKWINAHNRFVEEVKPRGDAAYFRVLTDDGTRVQKHYLIGKDTDHNYVLPVKLQNLFYAPNRPTFIPGLPNVFGGNMDPGDANEHATATREMHEETNFAYTSLGGTNQVSSADQGGNRLHFRTGNIRPTTIVEQGQLVVAAAPFTQEMNIPMGQFTFKAYHIDYQIGITTDFQIRTQILNLFAAQKNVNLADPFFTGIVHGRNQTPLQEFHNSHATQALVDKVKQDHTTNYFDGRNAAQTGQVALLPHDMVYMEGYNEYGAGLARSQNGLVAQHLDKPAYMSGFNEYHQGLADVQGNAAVANANVAYMTGRNEYAPGLTDVQGNAVAANANAAYMTARNEYAQGMADEQGNVVALNANVAYIAARNEYAQGSADGPGGVVANPAHVAYMAGFNSVPVVHNDKRRRT